MSLSYGYLDDDTLHVLLKTYVRNIAHLEKQAALYGSIHVPVRTINQINDTQRIIEALNSELTRRKGIGNTVLLSPPVISNFHLFPSSCQVILRGDDTFVLYNKAKITEPIAAIFNITNPNQ